MKDKKWVYGLVIGLVVLIALGAGCCYKARSSWVARQAQLYTGVNNPVYGELFLLNSSSLKLNAEQARAILPLVEQMKNADSATSQELARQVYVQLNSQQYQALLARGNSRQKANSRVEQHRPIMNRNNLYEKNNGHSQLLAALPDLVVKQLQEIAAGQAPVSQTPTAAQPGQNQTVPQAGPGTQPRTAP
ncbi:MAG: hypothetical protein ABRQ26_02980 [Syntrophomonadaceae bacterium]